MKSGGHVPVEDAFSCELPIHNGSLASIHRHIFLDHQRGCAAGGRSKTRRYSGVGQINKAGKIAAYAAIFVAQLI